MPAGMASCYIAKDFSLSSTTEIRDFWGSPNLAVIVLAHVFVTNPVYSRDCRAHLLWYWNSVWSTSLFLSLLLTPCLSLSLLLLSLSLTYSVSLLCICLLLTLCSYNIFSLCLTSLSLCFLHSISFALLSLHSCVHSCGGVRVCAEISWRGTTDGAWCLQAS